MISIPWQERYKHKLRLPQEALNEVRSGRRVFVGTGCGEPQLLVAALGELGEQLADAEIINILALGVAPYVEPEFKRAFRYNSLFLSGRKARKAISEGRGDYTPAFLSEVPAFFRTGRIPIDVALIQVSPPDEHGFCSYGVSVDITKPAAESAGIVIAEVNPNMPRTLGDSFVHTDDIDILVESNIPLLEANPRKPDEIGSRIAENVAELIEDGSTLQVGIGAMPEAVLFHLKNKKDLGIHTEQFGEGIIDLIESGVVTCRKKNLHPGKIVASFCVGTKRLYDFIDNNPLFEFHASDYTNDPFIISQNDRMVAVNGALEVDLTGQVCADSSGYYFYSGVGGHLDFIRGAARSKGGKPIIVLPSTTRDGTKSRIVLPLSEGAGVVTTRSDAHYIVTEYGVAYLHGKSIRERAIALINIAHPKFRDELLTAAKEHHYVYPDQILPPQGVQYPKEVETYKVFPGSLTVFVRPIKPTDERMIQEFFYSLSDKAMRFRFFHQRKAFYHEDIQSWVNIDYTNHMAIVGIIKDEKGRDIIVALAQYMVVDESEKIADIGVVVADQYQGRGIGSFFTEYLAQVAKKRGIAKFKAEVLAGNTPMFSILQKFGYKTVDFNGPYSEMLREL